MKLKIFGKEIEAKKVSSLRKFIGLMFKSRDTKPLFFDFREEKNVAIHSFFCHTFYAIWLNSKKKIVDMKKVKPFTFAVKPKEKFRYLVEVPNNKYYSKINKILDEKIERFK